MKYVSGVFMQKKLLSLLSKMSDMFSEDRVTLG